MIDIENEILTLLYDGLSTQYQGIDITSEYVANPLSMPHIEVYEIDNVVDERTTDSSHTEYSAKVTYQVSVYTNDMEGKKTKAKKIMKSVDDILSAKGFYRISCMPLQNYLDSTIYRVQARYRAYVTNNKKIYNK